ncbi:MAG: hypothetical protein KAH16_02855 [Candidatus Izimaplasma sp.]|nr:hypothetical protein [Candidatus Izimaplasma bacterium]
MKPSIRKVIKFDYLSTLLFIISLVVTLLFIAILASGVTEVLGIIVPVFIVSNLLLILRVYLTRKAVYKLKDSRINAVVHRVDKNNGNLYIIVNYEVNTRSLGKRIPILAGPVLRARLRKLKDIELLVDPLKPKKVFIAELFY